MVETTAIEAGIATFKRPHALRELLESLRSQQRTDETCRLVSHAAALRSSVRPGRGEDIEFFYWMHLANRRLVRCDDVWATEPVASARLTHGWLRRRGFCAEQAFMKILLRRYTAYKKPLWFVLTLAQINCVVLALPLVRLMSYPRVALTVWVAAATSQLSYCFSEKNHEEYRVHSCH